MSAKKDLFGTEFMSKVIFIIISLLLIVFGLVSGGFLVYGVFIRGDYKEINIYLEINPTCTNMAKEYNYFLFNSSESQKISFNQSYPHVTLFLSRFKYWKKDEFVEEFSFFF
jgi:hypothetical protein